MYQALVLNYRLVLTKLLCICLLTTFQHHSHCCSPPPPAPQLAPRPRTQWYHEWVLLWIYGFVHCDMGRARLLHESWNVAKPTHSGRQMETSAWKSEMFQMWLNTYSNLRPTRDKQTRRDASLSCRIHLLRSSRHTTRTLLCTVCMLHSRTLELVDFHTSG